MNESRSARALMLAIVIVLAGGCGQRGGEVEQQLARGKEERAKGNYTEAIIHLKNVVQAAPENAAARYELGMAYTETGDHASAEKELRRALELHYNPAEVSAPLARALIALGEYHKVLDQMPVESVTGDAAQAELLALRGIASLALRREKEGRALLEQALAKQPAQVDALLGLARIAAAGRQFDEAMALVERAIAAAPRNVDAWLIRGDLRRLQVGVEAASDYRKVIELNAGNVPARLSLISLHISAGELDAATTLLAEARKLAPRNPMVQYAAALIDFRKKDYAAARDAVQQVLKSAPNHPPSLLLAGAVEYALGAHVQAQTYLGRVVERAPGNLYARRLLVSSLARSGQTQRAQEVLAPGLKQAPGDAALLRIAGELAMQSNDFAKAREYFERAAKADPQSAGARTGLAVSRLAAGDAEAGVADLTAAADMDSDRYQADILLVTTHLQRARFDDALKAARTLEKKQPNNPLTYNLLAAAYLGKKDIESARRQLTRALELQPTYLPAALNLAQIELQGKNPQGARRYLEAIVTADKDNVEALLALASFGPRIGATQKEQLEWIERAGRASPTTVRPRLVLARFHAQSGEVKKALGVAQQTAASHPDNPEVLETLGSIQLAAGEKNQAVATFGKLVTLQQRSPVAFLRLATAQSVAADADGAAGSLRKALALKPDFVEAQLALAELESRAGRHAEGIAIARQIQKQAPKSPTGYALEGDVQMAAKKYPEAVAAYETAYGRGRSGALAMKLHAAYARTGKPGEGETRLAQWLKANPDDGAVRLYAADAGIKAGRYRIAIEHYEWLIAKQPDNVVVLNNLAWCYQQVKDPRAVETAERAYKLKPDNPAVTDTLGWLLVEQGATARGIELLQKATAAAPKAPEIRYHLAQAWVKAGESRKARDELERLLTDDTAFPQRSEALELLKKLRSQSPK